MLAASTPLTYASPVMAIPTQNIGYQALKVLFVGGNNNVFTAAAKVQAKSRCAFAPPSGTTSWASSSACWTRDDK